MLKHKWLEYFKEQLQGLEGFYEEIPRTESLLQFVLAQDLLKEDDYFNWAKAHYKLPRLKASYFIDHTPSPDFWAKHSEIFTWSSEALPICEWDGHLIIATLNPEIFALNPLPNAIIQLADPGSLNKWHQVYQSFKVNHVENSVNSMPSLVAAQKNESELIDLELVDDSIEHITPEELSEIEEGSPEGLETHLDLQALETPEGISISSEAPPAFSLDFTSLMGSPEKSTEHEVKNSVVETQQAPAPAPPPVIALVKAEVTAPVPPPPPPQILEASDLIRPIPHAIRSESGSSTTVGFSMDPWKSDFLKVEAAKTFQKMKSHFEKSLLIALSDDESRVKVQFWDENFKKPEEEKNIPLKTPSIFNIVAQTAKSFHGPISINEVNERFFENWNKDQIPSHTTITPIIVNDKLIGMLMGFANTQSFNKATLNYAEKVCADFSKDLARAAS